MGNRGIEIQEKRFGGIVRRLNKIHCFGRDPFHVVGKTQGIFAFGRGTTVVHVTNVKTIGEIKPRFFCFHCLQFVSGRGRQPG